MAMKKWWRFAAHWVPSPGQKSAIQSLSRWNGGNLVAAALVALATLSFSGLAHSQTDPMVDPSTGKPYPRGTATYVPPGTAVNPGPMTQADINAISDSSARASAQWQFNQAKIWPTQSDGIERGTDVNTQGKARQYFTPQKLTAADCLVGRHWEIVGGYAGCVCDGDATHTRVSNDQPAACTAVPPPPPPPPVVTTSWENQSFPCPAPATGTIFQTRQVTTTNGVSTYGPWTAAGDNCSLPPPPPSPVITTGTETQTFACSPPQVGSGVIQTRQVTYTDSVPSAYGNWVTVSVDCAYPFTPPIDPWVTGYTFFPNPCWPAPVYGVPVLQSQLAASGLFASYDAAWAASVEYSNRGACVGGG